MLTLAIDTSTSLLSIALVRNEKTLAVIDEWTKNNQSEILMSRIEQMMNECGLRPNHLEKIAVAVGPGSYTGVRVGVTAAKSLGYTLNIPVVGISSLKVMALAAVVRGGACVPMIDARRGTVFAGVYDWRGDQLVAEGHYLVDDLLERLDFGVNAVAFVGDGAVAHKEKLLANIANASVRDGADFSKSEVVARFASGRLPQENIHCLVPNYLRKTEAELNAGV